MSLLATITDYDSMASLLRVVLIALASFAFGMALNAAYHYWRLYFTHANGEGWRLDGAIAVSTTGVAFWGAAMIIALVERLGERTIATWAPIAGIGAAMLIAGMVGVIVERGKDRKKYRNITQHHPTH